MASHRGKDIAASVLNRRGVFNTDSRVSDHRIIHDEGGIVGIFLCGGEVSKCQCCSSVFQLPLTNHKVRFKDLACVRHSCVHSLPPAPRLPSRPVIQGVHMLLNRLLRPELLVASLALDVGRPVVQRVHVLMYSFLAAEFPVAGFAFDAPVALVLHVFVGVVLREEAVVAHVAVEALGPMIQRVHVLGGRIFRPEHALACFAFEAPVSHIFHVLVRGLLGSESSVAGVALKWKGLGSRFARVVVLNCLRIAHTVIESSEFPNIIVANCRHVRVCKSLGEKRLITGLAFDTRQSVSGHVHMRVCHFLREEIFRAAVATKSGGSVIGIFHVSVGLRLSVELLSTGLTLDAGQSVIESHVFVRCALG